MTNATPPAPRGVSIGVVVLCVLFTLLAAEGAVLIALHFLSHTSTPTPTADSSSTPRVVEPFAQQGTVNTDTAASTTVFYPTPFASPPNLTLTIKDGGRRFAVVRQDEFGFTWRPVVEVTLPADPSRRPWGKVEGVEVGSPVFGWEAKGVVGKSADLPPRPFEQTGTFPAPWSEEGEVYFAAPYATPPNVTLAASTGVVMVTTVTPLGFTWKNPLKAPATPSPAVTWTAAGTRATPGQPLPVVKADMPLKLTEQTGEVPAIEKQKGEEYFPHPYATPPNIKLMGKHETDRFNVVQVTATSFKWECAYSYGSAKSAFTWTAKGVLANTVPTEK